MLVGRSHGSLCGTLAARARTRCTFLPVPVIPVMRTLWCSATQRHAASWRSCARSISRFGEYSMSSRHALDKLELGVAQCGGEPLGLAMQPLGVDEHPEALVERQACNVGLALLLIPGGSHRVESHGLEFLGRRFLQHDLVAPLFVLQDALSEVRTMLSGSSSRRECSRVRAAAVSRRSTSRPAVVADRGRSSRSIRHSGTSARRRQVHAHRRLRFARACSA